MLEREVEIARAGRPLEPKGTPGWVIFFAWLGGFGASGMVLVFGMLAIGSVSGRSADDPSAGRGHELLPTPSPTIGASWYIASSEGPQVAADLNGDGKKDLVGLFWRAPEDTPLYVAAVDRVSLEPIWVAGPYPSQWAGPHTHLAVTDRHVVVADSRETLHVLDLRSGALLADVPHPGGSNQLCARLENPSQLLLTHDDGSYLLLDPATQTLRKLEGGESTACWGERVDCKFGGVMACMQVDRAVAARSKLKDFHSYGSVRSNDTLLATGGRKIPELEEREPWLVVSNATAKTLRWTSSSVLPGDTLHLATRVDDQLTPKAVVSFYQRNTGEFRLVARALGNGAVSWRTSVEAAKEGSIARLFVLDGDVFVFADQRMHAYDLETGAELQVSRGI